VNYRHAFHAGNPADVFKHALLAHMLALMTAKDKPLRYLDTHAGAGSYDLSAEEALRGGEAERGIRRLLAATLSARARPLLSPYLDAVAALAGPDGRYYPGSPLIAAHLLRPMDRLTLVEKHPEDIARLKRRLAPDRRAFIVEGDGWVEVRAKLPLPERRGLVLMDPPFEQPDEFRRLATALSEGHRRFATGVFALWYPIKAGGESRRFVESVRALALPATLLVEMVNDPRNAESALQGSGMVIVNPPWGLDAEARVLVPELARALAPGRQSRAGVEWLVPEA
jgi:23S rRNA (adenine2030-N6)-methyltransferase